MRRVAVLLPVLLACAGCGSQKSGDVQTTQQDTAGPGLPAAASAAMHPKRADFPAVKGRTLQQVADGVKPGLQVGLGAATFLPGTDNRVPFGIVDEKQRPIYGPTALYVADTPSGKARGPFLAPGDSLVVAKKFRSKIVDRADLKVAYAAHLRLPAARRYSVLAISRTKRGLIGGATQMTVLKSSPIPRPGQAPPRVATDTKRTQPDPKLLDTRLPPDDMHATSFRDVVGRKPVALLFSTPQLCQSRVCGPVTDILYELEQRYRGRMTFIHQEVYAKNKPPALRAPLEAFHLKTEPWLFVIDRRGRVAARLEGIFGLKATDAALRAGLR